MKHDLFIHTKYKRNSKCIRTSIYKHVVVNQSQHYKDEYERNMETVQNNFHRIGYGTKRCKIKIQNRLRTLSILTRHNKVEQKKSKKKSWGEFGKEMEKNTKSKVKLFYRVLKLIGISNKTSTQIYEEKRIIVMEEKEVLKRLKEFTKNCFIPTIHLKRT